MSQSNCKTIGQVRLGETTWRIDSDCGVVKIHSSRDGCMAALNTGQARGLAQDLASLLRRAANSVDRATAGGPR